MPTDFPSNPAVGDEFTGSTGVTYIWDGVKWVNGVCGGGGMTQTPWLSNIDGAFFALDNAGGVSIDGDSSPGILSVTSLPERFECDYLQSRWLMNGAIRWAVGKANSPEIGSNAGSEFTFRNYNDAGSFMSIAMQIQRNNGFVGINGVPQFRLDVMGDINITDIGGANGYAFRINGVPLSTGASQTPWLSNIDGANFSLGSAQSVGIGGPFDTSNNNRLLMTGAFGDATIPPTIGMALFQDNAQTKAIQIGIFKHGPSTGGSWIQSIDLSADSNAPLTLQPAGGNVGIGTYSPVYALDCVGDCNISAGSVYRINGVPLSTGSPQTPWAQNINGNGFTLSNTLNITSTGRTGIGTGNPEVRLDVAGNAIVRGESGTPLTGSGLFLSYSTGSTRGLIYPYNFTTSAYTDLLVDGKTLYLNFSTNGPVVIPSSTLSIGYPFPIAGMQTGDLNVTESGSTNQASGKIYFGSSGNASILFDGTSWVFNPALPSPVSYKTTEQFTGITWIDGKKIYQTTLSIPAPNIIIDVQPASNSIPHGIANIQDITGLEGIAWSGGSNYVPLTFANYSGVAGGLSAWADRTNLTMTSNLAQLINIFPDPNSIIFTITFRYTCTNK